MTNPPDRAARLQQIQEALDAYYLAHPSAYGAANLLPVQRDYVLQFIAAFEAGLLDQVRLLTAGGAPVSEPPAIDVEAMRANLHATFNGGWHDSVDGLRAFHHGMDTVCNVLDGYQKGEPTNGILPPGAAPAPEAG